MGALPFGLILQDMKKICQKKEWKLNHSTRRNFFRFPWSFNSTSAILTSSWHHFDIIMTSWWLRHHTDITVWLHKSYETVLTYHFFKPFQKLKLSTISAHATGFITGRWQSSCVTRRKICKYPRKGSSSKTFYLFTTC